GKFPTAPSITLPSGRGRGAMLIPASNNLGVGGPAGTRGAAPGRPASGGPAAGEADPHVPDPEVLRLVEGARQAAGTRPGPVEAVAARLARGEHLTRAAAERAASALLDG